VRRGGGRPDGGIAAPEEFWEAFGMKKRVRVKRGRPTTGPVGPVSRRFYGAFRAAVPEDLDGLVVEAMASWWWRGRA